MSQPQDHPKESPGQKSLHQTDLESSAFLLSLFVEHVRKKGNNFLLY